MLRLEPPNVKTILCLGAHCDDIEIGCGGTLLKFLKANPNAHVHWLVFSSNEERAAEARASAASFLEGAGSNKVVIADFKDGFLPYFGGHVKEYFEKLKGEVSPDLIFTHYGQDLHQDHRLLSELTWNTFRDHLILEYEIPKYDGGLGSPNVFVRLSESQRRRKIELIMEHFKSQAGKGWFTKDTFDALMRLRGMESNSKSKFAEGFYARKICY